ncbi:acetylornithine deacetylase/succinyl-diaminopimelate desuccinylase-like protein [Microvirga flocculans]|uniref:Acetylornithine deacetylase/succinyl-diaminopimelate desuccinylase-like protein n=1 Tax=Microvirga flocculans TaxID=217168 RepID=A0A7W6IF11_9HYPH|nr:dipeptidase [Microvirga flocculans]MBB4039685.1 acetylornithine deacetylase/succinyl-diaminopimelate desuccinylase-like protein [Microvirga flocculans]
MTDHLPAVLDRIDADLDKSLERLFAFIRIPSISTDPAYKDDCRKAAEWMAAELRELGFDAQARSTTGHPMVVGHHAKAVQGPHVLFYGHYDVQPVDPLELWKTPPFEPTLVAAPNGDTWIVARGASDDKGALMTFIEACRAWKAVTGELPLRVSILLEGEEESGSPSLKPFLEANRDELSLDLALVCDTDMWDNDTPAVTTMLRGLVGEEVEITCADRDLHSGMFGSAARNPIHLLTEALASLRDSQGRITLPGFYDGVQELPAAVKDQWNRLPFDEAGFLGQVGLSIPAGEKGRSVLEQIWARPTCEVNGIVGGYTGEGFKTVIPSKASAKVSFRLVAGQDPAKIREAFRAHIRERIPADCSVTFKEHGGSPALSLPLDGPFLKPTLDALTEEWGCEAALAGTGGSIPIVGDFKRLLGMDSLMVGFARFDNRVHSPNEKYDLSSFHHGIRSWARILAALARQG